MGHLFSKKISQRKRDVNAYYCASCYRECGGCSGCAGCTGCYTMCYGVIV